MANPTTNFGWVMPTSTSLVTNLPADFNTFGQGVDTSMAQLKGGTTGQILSKTSATDMAFTWITPNPGDITGVTAGTGISGGGTSGDVTITNSMATAMTTKGDLVPATGSGTFSRLAVGTNGQTLVADSSTATGLKWATAKVVQIVSATYATSKTNSTGSYVDTDLTATITPTSASNKILVMWTQGGLRKSNGGASNGCYVQLLRGATQIALSGNVGWTNTVTELIAGSFSANIVDSPATTSATTYKSQFANNTNGASVTVQDAGATSTLVLMEVTP